MGLVPVHTAEIVNHLTPRCRRGLRASQTHRFEAQLPYLLIRPWVCIRRLGQYLPMHLHTNNSCALGQEEATSNASQLLVYGVHVQVMRMVSSNISCQYNSISMGHPSLGLDSCVTLPAPESTTRWYTWYRLSVARFRGCLRLWLQAFTQSASMAK